MGALVRGKVAIECHNFLVAIRQVFNGVEYEAETE